MAKKWDMLKKVRKVVKKRVKAAGTSLQTLFTLKKSPDKKKELGPRKGYFLQKKNRVGILPQCTDLEDFPAFPCPGYGEDCVMLGDNPIKFDLCRSDSVPTLWLYGSCTNLQFDQGKVLPEIDIWQYEGSPTPLESSMTNVHAGIVLLQQDGGLQEDHVFKKDSIASEIPSPQEEESEHCEVDLIEQNKKRSGNDVHEALEDAVDGFKEENSTEEALLNIAIEENVSNTDQGVNVTDTTEDEHRNEKVKEAKEAVQYINVEGKLDGDPKTAKACPDTKISKMDIDFRKTAQEEYFPNKTTGAENKLKTFQNQFSRNDSQEVNTTFDKLQKDDSDTTEMVVTVNKSLHNETFCNNDDFISIEKSKNNVSKEKDGTIRSQNEITSDDDMQIGKGKHEMFSKTKVDWKSTKKEMMEFQGSYGSEIVEMNTEMLDREGHKTRICIPNTVCGYGDGLKSTHKQDPGKQTEDVKLEREIAANPIDNICYESSAALNSFENTMIKTFPEGEVESVEGTFGKDTTDISMVIFLREPAKQLEKRKTEHVSIEVDSLNNCHETTRNPKNMTMVKSKSVSGRGSQSTGNLSTIVLGSFCFLLCPLGASGARINPLAPGNDDCYYQQIQLYLLEMFGNNVNAMVFIAGLYQFARREGRPLCNGLRHLFAQPGNIPRNGRVLQVPLDNAIVPGRGGGVVGRALPPRNDGIHILPPDRRANRIVRMYHPRNQDGDTRVLRVLQPRVVQVDEETDQANAPSEIVPSAHDH